MEKGRIRFRLIYRVGRVVAQLFLLRYGFRTNRLRKTDENYIVMSNHLTEKDMLMLGAAMKEPMYFVAGEHLLRSPAGKLMAWAQNPIFMYKGAGDLGTIREIVRRVKNGDNVMIFPEGSRSFAGETVQLPQSAARLVKLAGCGLITYHIQGGYFVAPRWAYTFRTGPVRGNIVHVYSAQEVRDMSREQLTEAINHDLYENAYETQRKHPAAYRGKRLAEGLENYLITCSRCGAFDTMITENDRFRCTKCGQAGRYTDTGFLEGEGLRFDSVYDWGKWSEEQLSAYIRGQEDGAVCFRDEPVTLYEITRDHRQVNLYTGDVTGFRDRLELGETVIPLKDITAIDMLYYGKTLLFTWEGRHLGITGEQFHALKYHKLYEEAPARKKPHPAKASADRE